MRSLLALLILLEQFDSLTRWQGDSSVLNRQAQLATETVQIKPLSAKRVHPCYLRKLGDPWDPLVSAVKGATFGGRPGVRT